MKLLDKVSSVPHGELACSKFVVDRKWVLVRLEFKVRFVRTSESQLGLKSKIPTLWQRSHEDLLARGIWISFDLIFTLCLLRTLLA